MMNKEDKISNWKQQTISNVAYEIRDLYEPSDKTHLPYIGLEHIKKNDLILSGIGSSKDVKSTKKKFKSGQILFGSLRPYFKKIYCPEFDGICSTDITVIQPKKSIDKNFLFYFLATDKFINFANNISYGTKMPRAKWEIIKNSKWLMPPLVTQKKIGTLLEDHKKLIENNIKRIKILETMAFGLYKDWFIKSDFSEYNNETKKDTKIGKIPSSWEYGKLDNICEVIPGFAFKSKDWQKNGIPIIKIKNIKKDNSIDIEQVDFVSQKIFSLTDKKYYVSNGDILIAMTGATAGKIGVLRSMNTFLLNQRVAKFMPKQYYYEFLWCHMTNPDLQNFFFKLADGTAQPNMSSEQIANTNLLIPSLEIIRKFSKIVSPMIKTIDYLYNKNKILNDSKNLLIANLISSNIETKTLKN